MSNSRLKSFTDRILRLKEEEDAIKDDIREVYAEMKGEGYDKTAAGQLVSYLRKVEKKGRDEIDNANAIFDLYLNEYENGTALASHAHEKKSREERARHRTSEAMEDNKAFSAELVDAGLISEEAHQENIRLSDGVARKFGAGVINEYPNSSATQASRPKADEESRDANPLGVTAPLSGQD
ncbi:DUF2312 domain-containing protein [Falsochrobactrum sp. TDYN1]|uniref:DUF2312 domain-containing protein n=1 Tax=Falsochrobactrum tianjinense TaxID=2706015 RepID=A0A949PNU3_9HYPH|nr:GapR family DNA-binding domain-containing protein [Falsochrobactrum sp. TDYN1]MBV2144213.1 DUF2312 domain-containing protein [Falsochrobactrum sp. TDYN1]